MQMQLQPQMRLQLDPDVWAGLVVGAVVGLWNAAPPMFQLLLILIAIDYSTGLTAGAINQELSSDIAWHGLLKKMAILLAVCMAVALEQYLVLPVDLDGAVAGFYAIREGLSITENLGRAGVPLPQELRDALLKLRPGRQIEPAPAPKVDHG